MKPAMGCNPGGVLMVKWCGPVRARTLLGTMSGCGAGGGGTDGGMFGQALEALKPGGSTAISFGGDTTSALRRSCNELTTDETATVGDGPTAVPCLASVSSVWARRKPLAEGSVTSRTSKKVLRIRMLAGRSSSKLACGL